MPSEPLSRILRAAAPAAVRLIACAAALLGRCPTPEDAGVSRASWYRHRAAALELAGLDPSQAEIEPRGRRSLAETSPRVVHSAVDKSGHLSTAQDREKPERFGGHALPSPPNHRFSTGQKRTINPHGKTKGRESAPICRGRALAELLRRDWLAARRNAPGLPALQLDAATLAVLEQRIAEDGEAEVVRVARSALAAAARGEIPGSWWARLFVGRGYEARRAHLEAEDRERIRRAALVERASRPLNEVELRLLGRVA